MSDGCSSKSQYGSIPGELDDAAQLHFSPAAAHERRAQRAHQVCVSRREAVLTLAEMSQQRGSVALVSSATASLSPSF